MNEFKLNQCIEALDKLIAANPDVLKETATQHLITELGVDYVDAGLAVHVWIKLRSQPDRNDVPRWRDC